MPQDVSSLLQRIQELNQSARKPGRLSRPQLEREVKKISSALQESLAELSTQLQQEGSSQGTASLEAFQVQLQGVMQRSGLRGQQASERAQLAQQLKGLKWRTIGG
jgi:hypothetical protein